MTKGLVCKLACGFATCACLASSVSAATFALRAVKKNGVDIAPTSTISAVVGDEITAEIRIFGFADELNAHGGVRSYQAEINGFAGAQSGGNGLVLPKGWDAPLESPVCLDENNQPDDSLCDFSPGLHCDPGLGRCVGANHAPATGIFLNKTDPEWLHAGHATIDGVSLTLEPLKFFSVVFDSVGTMDPGAGFEFYGGTVILQVKQFACGTFTYDFVPGPFHSFLVDPSTAVQVTPDLIPLTINTAACPPLKQSSDPDDCTIDARRPHPPTSTSPAEGISNVVFTFNVPTAGMTAAQFDVRVVPFGVAVPTITTSAVAGQPNQLRINFRSGTQATIIPTTRWTCVRHITTNRENCFGNLPGDVNGDLVTQPADAESLAGILRQTVVSLPECDQDRTGRCGPLDLLTEMDLLNGAASFTVWNNAGFVNATSCPSAN